MTTPIIKTNAERYFPPVAGGQVDTVRKQEAAHTAQATSLLPAPKAKPKPITVKIREPDMFGAKTITLVAGQSAQAMPADPNRKRGVLNLLTDSAKVLVARDRSAADTGTGYVMVSGNPPLELGHRREVWLNNPGTSTIQVSVLTESYEKE